MPVMTVSAMSPVVMTARVVLGFLPVSGNAGMCLLTRRELFSPTGQSQEQYSQKCEGKTLHFLPHWIFLSNYRINPSLC